MAEYVKLKPCPFCGGEAVEITKWMPVQRRHSTVVRCKECRANSGVWKIKKKASEHWNRRVES